MPRRNSIISAAISLESRAYPAVHEGPRTSASLATNDIEIGPVYEAEGLSDTELGTTLAEIARLIRSHQRLATTSVLQIGHLLLLVKARLPRGQFCEWISSELPAISMRSAQRMLSAADAFADEYDTVSYLPPTTVYELARSRHAGPRGLVLQRLHDGETLSDADIRKVIASEKVRVGGAPEKASDGSETVPIDVQTDATTACYNDWDSATEAARRLILQYYHGDLGKLAGALVNCDVKALAENLGRAPATSHRADHDR